MSRREWVACLGASLGLAAAQRLPTWLGATSGWPALVAQDPARDRRDPPPGRLPLRAAGLARAAREGHVHGHPYYWGHRLRQDLGGAVPLHRSAHPPPRPGPG